MYFEPKSLLQYDSDAVTKCPFISHIHLPSKPAVVDFFSDLSKQMCHCIRRELEKGRQFKQGKVSVSQPVIKIPRGREISGCADFKASCVFYYCVLQQIELCCAVVVDATK